MGGIIEYCIGRVGNVNAESVGMAVFYGGVKGLTDTGEGGGEVTDVVGKLDGWYW